MEPVKKFVTTAYGPGPLFVHHGLGRDVFIAVYDDKMQSVPFFRSKLFYGYAEIELGVFGWIDDKYHWFIPKEEGNMFTIVVIG